MKTYRPYTIEEATGIFVGIVAGYLTGKQISDPHTCVRTSDAIADELLLLPDETPSAQPIGIGRMEIAFGTPLYREIRSRAEVLARHRQRDHGCGDEPCDHHPNFGQSEKADRIYMRDALFYHLTAQGTVDE